MKKLRIALAALLVLAMMAPMTLASAQQVQETQTTTIVGVGSYANPAQADVWELKFPTEDNLKFTVDPKMMLGKTEAYRDPVDFTFNSSATVIFENFDKDGARLGFSSELEKVSVENQGTTDVVISMNIRPSDTNMILSWDGNLPTDNSTPSEKEKPILSFMAKESSENVWKNVSAVGENFSTTVKAMSSAFVVTGDVEGGFKYEQDGAVVYGEGFEWPRAQFSIKGAANKQADAKWTDDLTSPNLNITWYVRTTTTDALEIKFDEVSNVSIASGANYVMAADRKYALPGDMVTVYVQPSYPDNTSPTGYVVDKGPSQINTAFLNEYSKMPTKPTDDIITFGSGVGSDNHMMAYTFWVPREGGLQGFTTKYLNASDVITDGNVILIKGAPEIKKLVIKGSSSA